MSAKNIGSIAGVKIYQENGALFFLAGMTVDADGDECAYGPAGTEPLDYLANAGSPGNWWGITTDSHGNPYIQQTYHRAPGYYVSCTSMENSAFPTCNPDRYLDSSSIPFFVLPSDFGHNAKVGDLGFAVNIETGDNNAAIFGDVGPKGKLGEASINLAKTLGLSGNPKSGGTEFPIICYWLIPGSRAGVWLPVDTWWKNALSLFLNWGGLPHLKQLLERK
jgi:Fungal chitosanase of glycosyl hydrolase group 75